MMPVLTRGEHDHMHKVVPIVPLIGHHTIANLTKLYEPRNETMHDIDALCQAMDRASKPYLTHQLERDLAGLAIEALLMEKQVLKEIWYG